MQKWHISDTWNLYFPIQSQFRVNNRWCSSLFLFLFPQTFVFFSVMLNCIRGKLNFLFWEFLGYKISLFPISPLPWNLTPSKVTTNIKSLHHSLFCQTFQLSKQNTCPCSREIFCYHPCVFQYRIHTFILQAITSI